MRKINEKNRKKARTTHIPLPDAVTREIITALAVINLRTKSTIKYTKRNIAIASLQQVLDKINAYDTLKIFKQLLPQSLAEFSHFFPRTEGGFLVCLFLVSGAAPLLGSSVLQYIGRLLGVFLPEGSEI